MFQFHNLQIDFVSFSIRDCECLHPHSTRLQWVSFDLSSATHEMNSIKTKVLEVERVTVPAYRSTLKLNARKTSE